MAAITGQVQDLGSQRFQKFIDDFHKNIRSDVVDFKFTGSVLMIDKNNNTLSYNLLSGLTIAFILISIIMGILYRSIKIVLVALVPNIIPLLISLHNSTT